MKQLQRARSFVDPTINQMIVSDFDLMAYLAWERKRPVSGSTLLANFLHEFTHWWCFNSMVGSTLASLRMRAAFRAYRDRSAFDDYVRCMTAGTILEPFAEGLALFAEFDTYPGESSRMSLTLSTSLLFFTPAVDTDGKPILLLEGLLQKLRRDPMLLERKAGVYAAPTNEFDPYLIGYLSVHSLWCQMSAACTKLNDRDLFLQYLRSYIYEDPGMILCILDSYPSELHAANSIVNHLLSRIRDLVSFDGLSERVELWIQTAEKGSLDMASILAKTEDLQRAQKMMKHAWVVDVEDDLDTTLAAWMLMTLEERRVCIIASSSVRLESQHGTDHLDIFAQGASEPMFSISGDSVKGANEGEVVLVGLSKGQAIVTLLRVDQDVKVLSIVGSFDESELDIAKRHVANRPITASLHEKFRANLENSADVTTIWKIVAEQVSPAMNELFGPLATLNAKESEWQEAFSTLQRDGLFGILDQDAELTRAIASIGLTNTYSTNVNVIRMMSKVLGVEDKALDQAINLSQRHGLPLITKKGEAIIALV